MLGCDEVVDCIHGGSEQNRMALEAGLIAEGASQMGFPQTDPADKDHIAFVFNELQSKQILYLDLVDFFGPGPVELIQGFDHGEPCGFHTAGDGAILAQDWIPAGSARRENGYGSIGSGRRIEPRFHDVPGYRAVSSRIAAG